ncbi:hypothetical protein RFI_09037 [Reticulomyxa filosa]|uniref:40S ribosomal protein S28 n=1 Tax=Reticulomyxa filosa TaxID=46433 RepID=X6NP87_RETFI|nr:hypothetical protein RFI_09037 [Reticulomyxa filosa]|eukprot:ETO28095.1 hypothetical protein RFI_09037 [Reticulomyxa filosa]
MSKKGTQGKKKKAEEEEKEIDLEANLVHAKVLGIVMRTGARGQVTQVKVSIPDPTGNKPRILYRNVAGPVKKGDFLCLLESEREARRLR